MLRKYFKTHSHVKIIFISGGFGKPPTFHLAPFSFEYTARQKCIHILSFGGDCSTRTHLCHKPGHLTRGPLSEGSTFKVEL